MWSVAPASVMLLAVVGLLIVAFATTRMAFLERKLRRTSLSALQPASLRQIHRLNHIRSSHSRLVTS